MNRIETSQHHHHHSSAKAIVTVLIIVFVIGGGLWWWRIQKNVERDSWGDLPPIDVIITTLEYESAPVTLETLGEIRSAQQVLLSSQVAGRVSKIFFESGQSVKAGSVLVQLDDAPERAQLISAKADSRLAKAQLARAKQLIKTHAISDEILQKREAEYERAYANVIQIEARIAQLKIVAPFSGELGLRQIDLGEYLSTGEPIATLTALKHLYVNFDLPQQELSRVTVGQSVSIFSEIDNQETIEAEINAIERQVNRNTRNITFQAEVAKTQSILRPGMYVTVRVNLPDEPNSIIVPNTAIMTSSNGNTAAVVRHITSDGIGIGDIVPIKVSRRLDGKAIIEKGLHPGDVVVTEGQLRVRPGAKLNVNDLALMANKTVM